MATATSLQAPKASKALVLHGAKDLRLESREVSPPTGSDVQVAIRATGLCGSDLHYYNHGRNGDFVVREPLCLGHESAGTVTARGPEVRNVQVGDRVALEVGLPCRKCALCKRGRYNICPDLRFRSSAKTFPHLDGTLMELTNHPSEMCHKLPEHVSFKQAALLEPLAVCLHAIHRSNPPTQEEVTLTRSAFPSDETAALIFGAGAIGLLLASALARTQPFTKIVIADIDPSRLSIASSLSSTIETSLLPKSNPTPPTPPPASASPSEHTAHTLSHAQSLAKTLCSTHSVPHGFSRVYDCTGVPTCVQTGIYASRPGGSITQIGMGSPVQTLPIGAAALREVDIIGVFRYDGLAYPAAVELVGSGKLDGVEEKVVTHMVGLEEGERAFELAGKGVDEDGRPVVKVVVES